MITLRFLFVFALALCLRSPTEAGKNKGDKGDKKQEKVLTPKDLEPIESPELNSIFIEKDAIDTMQDLLQDSSLWKVSFVGFISNQAGYLALKKHAKEMSEMKEFGSLFFKMSTFKFDESDLPSDRSKLQIIIRPKNGRLKQDFSPVLEEAKLRLERSQDSNQIIYINKKIKHSEILEDLPHVHIFDRHEKNVFTGQLSLKSLALKNLEAKKSLRFYASSNFLFFGGDKLDSTDKKVALDYFEKTNFILADGLSSLKQALKFSGSVLSVETKEKYPDIVLKMVKRTVDAIHGLIDDINTCAKNYLDVKGSSFYYPLHFKVDSALKLDTLGWKISDSTWTYQTKLKNALTITLNIADGSLFPKMLTSLKLDISEFLMEIVKSLDLKIVKEEDKEGNRN